MVESIADHFVTIDKCEAVSECDDCPKIINIQNLFTLAGEPPFDFTAFGLPSELAEKIQFTYNIPTKVQSLFCCMTLIFQLKYSLKVDSRFFIFHLFYLIFSF